MSSGRWSDLHQWQQCFVDRDHGVVDSLQQRLLPRSRRGVSEYRGRVNHRTRFAWFLPVILFFKAIVHCLPGYGDKVSTWNIHAWSVTKKKNNKPNRTGAWTADGGDIHPWIQANFDGEKRVTSTTTQGRSDASEWVMSYQVAYRDASGTWQSVRHTNNRRISFRP